MTTASPSSPLRDDARRIAAIDIGTNSVLLLVAELTPRGVVPVLERATITRLGKGVDRTRRLDPEAIDRTLACLSRYASEARAAGVERIVAVGTSAMRDAAGGDDFRDRAQQILGEAPRVVSGDEEAQLTFLGALAGVHLDPAHEDEILVFDVGGGSTEIIVGKTNGGAPRSRVSLDIGSVRLTERHVRTDPISPGELEAVRADVRAALATVPFAPVPACLGVAGTVTTLFAFAENIAPYDASRVHGGVLAMGRVREATSALTKMSVAERRGLASIDPARADVIVSGALLVEEVLTWCGAAQMRISDRGVRWGLAIQVLHK